MTLDLTGTDRQLEMSSKEPLDVTHEIDSGVLLEEKLEFGLDGSIIGEIDEVMNVETEGKMGCGMGVRRVVEVDNIPAERQGSYAFCFRPRASKMDLIFMHQWHGLQRRSYSVHFSNQYSSFFTSGLPRG